MGASECYLDVARAFMAALNAGDEQSIRAIYAEDAEIWHNFDLKSQTVDENVQAMHWLRQTLSNAVYEVDRLVALPDGFVQQHVVRGTLANGEDFSLHACAIGRIVDGRITRLEEYLDTRQAAALYA